MKDNLKSKGLSDSEKERGSLKESGYMSIEIKVAHVK